VCGPREAWGCGPRGDKWKKRQNMCRHFSLTHTPRRTGSRAPLTSLYGVACLARGGVCLHRHRLPPRKLGRAGMKKGGVELRRGHSLRAGPYAHPPLPFNAHAGPGRPHPGGLRLGVRHGAATSVLCEWLRVVERERREELLFSIHPSIHPLSLPSRTLAPFSLPPQTRPGDGPTPGLPAQPRRPGNPVLQGELLGK
jgi:hypothetical protein